MPRLASSSRYCRVSGTGYRGVRARPKGTYYAEIRDGGERIGLGTYETAHEAARAYDAVAWRLGRPRSSMNFHDVWTRQQAEDLAPPPYIVRQEEQRITLHRKQNFPTANTQSKPRCNLEDGSNEGLSSLTLEEIPKPTRGGSCCCGRRSLAACKSA
ncbi:hypothetical protein QYE76_038204 [Lolium multiflorum]|uniref:AP2/ERF domain-containing protein n=1 Tax=Lolium multiflorum TaxID=4521 RepID=A0AAD8WSP3_LOLMU|nr:hypothetical protein QYE76_038204 [Lolium multiflorum]